MSIDFTKQARPLSETLTADDGGRIIPLKGFFNIKVSNTGETIAYLFNKSLVLMPGIPQCIGVEGVALSENTKLEFANGTGIKEVKIIKYEIISCT